MSVKTVLLWLLFLPVGLVLITLAQLATGFLATSLPPWAALSLVLFFGIIVALAGIIPCSFAPNPAIGATVLVTIFALLEGISLLSFVPAHSWSEVVIRLYTDGAIIFGAIVATNQRRPESL